MMKLKLASFVKKSIANSPCNTGRPFSIDGVYVETKCALGRNAAGPKRLYEKMKSFNKITREPKSNKSVQGH